MCLIKATESIKLWLPRVCDIIIPMPAYMFPTLLRLGSCFEMSTAVLLLSSFLPPPSACLAQHTAQQRCLQTYAQGALLGSLAARSTTAEVGKTNLLMAAWLLRAGRTPRGPGSRVDQSGS